MRKNRQDAGVGKTANRCSRGLQGDVEEQLQTALEQRQFTLAYQPQYDLHTGRVRGMEALLRWAPPGKEPTLPPTFISTAEESGLIMPIGEWVLRTACAQVRAWGNGIPCVLAVNLSPKQFACAGEMIRRVLRETGFDPHSLELEITEQTIVEDFERASSTLRAVEALGVRTALDDFGTGYSSLQYLCRLPVQTLKLDRSFAAGLDTEGKESIVTASVIRMAHELSMRVVAEGVENELQGKILEEQGCDMIQGFLYARPMAEREAHALLA